MVAQSPGGNTYPHGPPPNLSVRQETTGLWLSSDVHDHQRADAMLDFQVADLWRNRMELSVYVELLAGDVLGFVLSLVVVGAVLCGLQSMS